MSETNNNMDIEENKEEEKDVQEVQEEYRSISFDQNYVFDMLPLSPQQKQKLVTQLREEEAFKK
jgi:hypothetical protein